MHAELRQALCAGYECLSSWSDTLDLINVFPVPDGDTGRNLVISLSALRRMDLSTSQVREALARSARGNSGNIAAGFLLGFLANADAEVPLSARARRGATGARQAIPHPLPGTMISVFDALAECLSKSDVSYDYIMDVLEDTVRATTGQIEALRVAKIVDSGALGMLIFLDGFLSHSVSAAQARDWLSRFPELTRFDPSRARLQKHHGSCVDAVLRADCELSSGRLEALRTLGTDLVTLREGPYLKIHLHTPDPAGARARLQDFGEVIQWNWDDFASQISESSKPVVQQAVHIVTDAAGSVTRSDARSLGMSLLDSYVHLGDLCIPETRLKPEDLYAAMRQGMLASTSQASIFERHQHYERISAIDSKIVYLCVGSVYTGNYRVASDWQRERAAARRWIVLDTGAASGRLGLIAIATARFALGALGVDDVIAYANRAIEDAQEYIFVDKLHYLARGGRVSKATALLADSIHLAPVISPLADGARKVATLRKQEDKVAFAIARAGEALSDTSGCGMIMLEYSDNRDYLGELVLPQIKQRFAKAEILMQPFSLTSGTHMGPGTWAIAVLPDGSSGREVTSHHAAS